jgi:hypothetical protein
LCVAGDMDRHDTIIDGLIGGGDVGCEWCRVGVGFVYPNLGVLAFGPFVGVGDVVSVRQ